MSLKILKSVSEEQQQNFNLYTSISITKYPFNSNYFHTVSTEYGGNIFFSKN
jgi:hypothetical protein